MGLKNLFIRKAKKNSKNTPQNGVVSHAVRLRIEEELEQVFNKFDVNGDGKISSSELGSMMRSLGHEPTENELQIIINELDGDGFIGLKEFIELNTKDIGSVELLETLKDAFSVFDVDNNGLITSDELCNVLGSLGEECSVEECRKMIAGVDRDGDGMINFDEFKVMMMNGGCSRFGVIEE
ncbi:putative EF-hand domain-containing protein [Helianthus annuus]|nr:putative EF-hand domain-containing protein [Helianthus annuus]